MTEALDMSLDDIIKNNKKSVAKPSSSAAAAVNRRGGSSRPRGRGHGRGLESGPGGPTRRTDNRVPARPNPYFVPQAYHVQEMLVGGKVLILSLEVIESQFLVKTLPGLDGDLPFTLETGVNCFEILEDDKCLPEDEVQKISKQLMKAYGTRRIAVTCS